MNDWVLKPRFPSLATGKISDFTGLYVLPLFLTDLHRRLFRPASLFGISVAIGSATAVCFTLAKSTEAGARFTESLWSLALSPLSLVLGRGAPHVDIVVDTSDLLAIIAVPLSIVTVHRQTQKSSA